MPRSAPAPRCPLCRGGDTRALATVHGRDYFDCASCRLAFVRPEQRPSPAEERARYETHENHPDDPGYRAFLDRLAAPLADRLEPGSEGLDYGAGPGPTLSVMLEERGFPTAIYDPYFAPDPAPLDRRYDFIACTETAEHFFEPARELDQLDRRLRPGGWLGIMTQLRDEARSFADWWYIRDPTHVCFYHSQTMSWIARDRGWSLERPHPNVALFRKPSRRSVGP